MTGEVKYAYFTAVVFLVLAVAGITQMIVIDSMEKRAAAAGVGKYVIENGKVTFQWVK